MLKGPARVIPQARQPYLMRQHERRNVKMNEDQKRRRYIKPRKCKGSTATSIDDRIQKIKSARAKKTRDCNSKCAVREVTEYSPNLAGGLIPLSKRPPEGFRMKPTQVNRSPAAPVQIALAKEIEEKRNSKSNEKDNMDRVGEESR